MSIVAKTNPPAVYYIPSKMAEDPGGLLEILKGFGNVISAGCTARAIELEASALARESKSGDCYAVIVAPKNRKPRICGGSGKRAIKVGRGIWECYQSVVAAVARIPGSSVKFMLACGGTTYREVLGGEVVSESLPSQNWTDNYAELSCSLLKAAPWAQYAGDMPPRAKKKKKVPSDLLRGNPETFVDPHGVLCEPQPRIHAGAASQIV